MKPLQFLTLALLLFRIFATQGQHSPERKDFVQKNTDVDKQYFIENKGQWSEDVLFLAQMDGLNAWITKNGIMYELYRTEIIDEPNLQDARRGRFELKKYNRSGQRINYKLEGNNAAAHRQGIQKLAGFKNYFIGNESAKHASNVGLYKEMILSEVYMGIDMRYYFAKGSLRYEYIIHPGADPNQIKFSISGNDKTNSDKKEELVIANAFGKIDMSNLHSYQKYNRKPVSAQYFNQGETWSISLGAYDTSQTLIISPLIYSTFIGGSTMDEAYAITVDASNNMYITGFTVSPNFDYTTGVFQEVNAGSWDVFVTKFNAEGDTLIFSTYIGGSASDYGLALTLDKDENIYIAGYTNSFNYDVTPGAFQTVNAGNVDVFVTKLNPTGTALIFSTLLGGSDGDYARSIKLDSEGNAYIGGYSWSHNFPTTAGVLQNVFGGASVDVFVSKLNATGTGLIYSTYIGGSDNEFGQALAVDASNNAYITGYAHTNYIVTPGAYQTVYGGGSDIFVSKINPSGTALVYSTYIGQNGGDIAEAIALDNSGNVYLTGSNGLGNFIVTSGAIQTIYEGGWEDAFFTKLNATGDTLLYSSYIGGNGDDIAHSIVLDSENNAYITGRTTSSNFDVTTGSFQTQNAGGRDVFLTKIRDGGSLLYSTYIGGSQNDVGLSIALDDENVACIAGITLSPDFDITEDAFQPTVGGNWDSFVAKLDTTINLSVTAPGKKMPFRLFPNPSQGVCQIVSENNVADAVIEAYDLQGRLIDRQQLTGKSNSFDLSKEPQGVYILKIIAADVSEVVRVIKL